ncbi:MAG: hypothetical protein KJI69_06170 [Patescibacteria group bacterium]|nr:hypothetical protein [Patescibacteria group bacterium]
MKIAFDIDDTLHKIRLDKRDQVPDFDLFQVLRWFHGNGDEVYVWSAGGIDYATNYVRRMGIDSMVTVIRKGAIKVDISFDDMETNLATVDVKVNRDSTEEEVKEITSNESISKKESES